MNLGKTISAFIIAGAVSGGASATSTNFEKLQDDGRICGQPFAGGIIRVSCNNIVSIIENQGGPGNVQFVPTRDGEDGEQFNQINDKNGNPILYIHTPTKKSLVDKIPS